ncbi:hypothetical protein H6P81_021616 [Aristolochia fimbriata]|uniref:Uncharacterized protein n=1 Tax=Aristolochia fimbriata TaxID=158543 RepID=A0AAV7DSC0_ARIFI|nr:hypothetical protein H6P81_021616 [Aristolochia fimbriata]
MKIDGECLIELIGSCRNKGGREPSLSRLYYRGLWGSRNRRALILGWAYYLDAFSSYPLRTWLPSVYRGHDNWYTRGKGPLNALTPTPDMDRTVSRRSEPSSRTALMGEQPNPWNILQPQVAKSRHRGAKPSRRCELLGKISLLSLGNFYPLSDGPSTRHRRITKADFRPCSTGGSCSQAPFCLCTRGANLRPARGNLCTPPLPFGRPTPHRNCLPETVPWPVGPDTRLNSSSSRWYLTDGSDPPRKEAFFAFHLSCAGKAQSQSQGTVVRIFTDMSISPSLSPRQCPDRYAFRAGRNLPDKEFRYLRTVIVTAAVHRGFGRRLPCHQVTNFLDLPALGRRQPPYVVLRLRGDLCFWSFELFLGYGMGYFSAVAPGTRTLARGIFSTPSYPALKKQGIFTCCPSTTPFGLILGPDSPSVDEPCGGTLRFSGHWILTNVCVTQADILASASSTPARAASADRLAPFIFGARRSISELLRTLSRGWLLLGKPPGCLCTPTSFITERHAVRDQFSPPTAWGSRFHVLFHSPMGFFSPFPHGTTSLSVTQGYLALQGGPCGFTRDSTCPMLLGSGHDACIALPQPRFHGLGCSHFARRYYGNRFCFLFLWLLRCFSSPGCLLPAWIQQQFERLTYSGISGSMLIFNSRSISSLATPFLVSGCLGIHQKVSHRFRYKILSLPPGQLDIQPVIATTQLQERALPTELYPRAKWACMKGQMLLRFFSLAQLGHPGLEPETSPVK